MRCQTHSVDRAPGRGATRSGGERACERAQRQPLYNQQHSQPTGSGVPSSCLRPTPSLQRRLWARAGRIEPSRLRAMTATGAVPALQQPRVPVAATPALYLIGRAVWLRCGGDGRVSVRFGIEDLADRYGGVAFGAVTAQADAVHEAPAAVASLFTQGALAAAGALVDGDRAARPALGECRWGWGQDGLSTPPSADTAAVRAVSPLAGRGEKPLAPGTGNRYGIVTRR